MLLFLSRVIPYLISLHHTHTLTKPNPIQPFRFVRERAIMEGGGEEIKSQKSGRTAESGGEMCCHACSAAALVAVVVHNARYVYKHRMRERRGLNTHKCRGLISTAEDETSTRATRPETSHPKSRSARDSSQQLPSRSKRKETTTQHVKWGVVKHFLDQRS